MTVELVQASRRIEETKIRQQQERFLTQSDDRAPVHTIVDSVGAYVSTLTEEELKNLVGDLREEAVDGFDRLLGVIINSVSEGQ